jgi:hypothetical protein
MFVKFTQTGRSFAPKVSIWSRGQIGFNNGAVTRFDLNKFDYVVFWFDKEEQKIGLFFTTDKTEPGAVKMNKRVAGISVGAKSFLDYCGIDYSTTKQYELSHDKQDNLYVIDLADGKAGEEEK